MHVLLAPDHIEPPRGEPGEAMDAVDVAAALARGWAQARPGDSIVAHPMSDGGAGFLDVLAATIGGEREVVLARDPRGVRMPVTWLRVGASAYVETAPVLGDPWGPDAATLAEEGSSAGVGDVILAAARAGVRRIVVGVPHGATHDAGLGMLHALADAEEQAPVAEVIAAAAATLERVEVIVAAATSEPLVGLSGAGAALAERPGIDAAAAQHRELALAGVVARIESAAPAPRSLLAGGGAKQVRPSRRPRAGAGGGVGFALGCIGARVLAGADVVAIETGFGDAVHGVELVLTAAGILDGGALDGGVPGSVGHHALAALVPAVAVAPVVLVSRRDLSGTGLEAVYPVSDPPRPGRPSAPMPLPEALSQRASRVATTWSR